LLRSTPNGGNLDIFQSETGKAFRQRPIGD